MSTSTKQRILDAAIRLFNQDGLANVRLQQIADEAGISVGNLAYHFRNKDLIATTVYETLFEEFAEILAHYLQKPGLADFDRQLDLYHDFFEKYPFYLIDLFEMERSNHEVMARWQQFVAKMLLQIRKRFDYCVQRGLLKAEPLPGLYDTLTHNIWMTIVFWIPQAILTGQSAHATTFKQAVWAHLNPYFTPQGQAEFATAVVLNQG